MNDIIPVVQILLFVAGIVCFNIPLSLDDNDKSTNRYYIAGILSFIVFFIWIYLW